MAQDTLPMVVYWHENQVAITFRSHEQLSAKRETVIASLHLDRLEQFLDENGFILTTFQEEDLLRRPPATAVSLDDDQIDSTADNKPPASINSLDGKYLFASPDNKGTSIVSFFHVEVKNSNSGATNTGVPASMDTDTDQYGYAGVDSGMKSDYYANDITLKAVCLVNEHLAALQNAEVPIVSAMPNWLKGGAMVGCIVEGCAITPPLPADAGDSAGRWKSILPTHLPASLQSTDGTGVTVLVLDTLRPYQEVAAVAASEAGMTNSLLQDIVKNVTFNYNNLSPLLDRLNPEQPGTGKDVYGRLIGFPMADHGIFVAGIVHDLVPGARIECIRVLNDFGVGNATGLMHVLENIQDRLRHIEGAGSPLNLPLVVNLSLTGTPSDEVLSGYQLDQTQIYQLREGLYEAIQSLAAQGVVFVASAGNDSDPRTSSPVVDAKDGTTPVKRFGPRYPAAFAYDEVVSGQTTRVGIPTIIPVGAVNQIADAASYSNYPGEAGIATYGGELPTPDPKDVPPTSAPALPYGMPTKIVEPVDALRGVYTSALFPAPSMDDRLVPVPDSAEEDYPEYQPAEATTWACWVGTSFATPIVSAITARMLQNQATNGDTVRKALVDVAVQKPLWTGLGAQFNEPASGNLIMVTQEYVADKGETKQP